MLYGQCFCMMQWKGCENARGAGLHTPCALGSHVRCCCLLKGPQGQSAQIRQKGSTRDLPYWVPTLLRRNRAYWNGFSSLPP